MWPTKSTRRTQKRNRTSFLSETSSDLPGVVPWGRQEFDRSTDRPTRRYRASGASNAWRRLVMQGTTRRFLKDNLLGVSLTLLGVLCLALSGVLYVGHKSFPQVAIAAGG